MYHGFMVICYHNAILYTFIHNLLCDQGRPQDLGGGGKNFFFRFGTLHVAKPCALLGGFGGMLPRENFLKRCNLVRIRVYFNQIQNQRCSLNHDNRFCLYFFFKNYHFLYKKINILDKLLLWVFLMKKFLKTCYD